MKILINHNWINVFVTAADETCALLAAGAFVELEAELPRLSAFVVPILTFEDAVLFTLLPVIALSLAPRDW